jgi:hypothetical protein
MDEKHIERNSGSGDPKWVVALVFGRLALEPICCFAQWIAEILARKSP